MDKRVFSKYRSEGEGGTGNGCPIGVYNGG